MVNDNSLPNESLKLATLQAQPKGKKSGKRKGYYKKYRATRKPNKVKDQSYDYRRGGRDDYYSE